MSCKKRRFGVFVDTDTICRKKQIEINKFKVTNIPDTMDKKGWKVSSALMRHWFNNGNHGWTNEQKKDFRKNVDALQLKSWEYNDNIVTMKWAMQFNQVKDSINILLPLIHSTKAKNQLVCRLQRKGWIKGSVKRLEKIDNVRTFEDGNQIQFLTIGNKENPLDDYLGALANTTLKVGLVGTTTKDDVEKHPFYDFTYITNDDFMEYRSKNHKGGDFFVFSDIYWVDAPKNTVIDIKGSACDDT